MLQISKLSVRYFVNDVPVQAVCSASLALSPGEAVGLLGESGCGKSTLARTILGLLPSTAEVKGSIRFEDVDITSATEADFRSVRGRKIALISQDPARTLNPVLTIGAQVSDVLRSHVSLSSSQGKARVMETLRSVGFDDPEQISRRYAHQLSGGERQRAAIAQAIVCRPALLLADEATSKLDARLKLELLRLFGSLRERYRMALLFITHEPAMAAAAAERLVVMYSGEIVEDGSAAAVLRNPLHPYTQALLQLARERVWTSGTPRARFSAIPGEPVSLHQGNCCYFQERCGQRLAGCTTRHPLPCHHDGREVLCMIYE